MTPPAEHCLDCHAPLAGRYCHECGQDNAHQRLRLRTLLRDAAKDITGLETPLLCTTRSLLRHPGRLSLDYVRGRRRRYLSPLKYVMFIAAIYGTLSVLLGMYDRMNEMMGAAALVDPDDVLMTTVMAWSKQAQETLSAILPLVSVPFVVGMAWLLYRDTNRTLAEHAVAVCYATALAMLLGLPGILINVFASETVVILNGLAFIVINFAVLGWTWHGFYGKSIAQTLWRAAVAMLVSLIGSGLFGALIGMIAAILAAAYVTVQHGVELRPDPRATMPATMPATAPALAPTTTPIAAE